MHAAKFNNWSYLRRFTYLACAFFVFSYICFDVLDLDGSNLAAQASPVQKTTIVEKTATEIDGAAARFKLAPVSVFSLPTPYTEQNPHAVQSATAPPTRRLSFIRSHRYRVALPRSSTPDPLHTL